MTCVAAILARNEEKRYLRETVESLRPLCDPILLLDDGSTDGTKALAWDLGCQVRERESGREAFGQESSARQELWAWGADICGDGWLYISDADHVTVADADVWRGLLTSWNVNAWAFPLLDCWDSANKHRVDGYWQGYKTPRPWLFRPMAVQGSWSGRGIHCGHSLEADWTVGIVPSSAYIKHLGWQRESDRIEKHSRYATHSGIMSEFELAHLATVLDTA